MHLPGATASLRFWTPAYADFPFGMEKPQGYACARCTNDRAHSLSLRVKLRMAKYATRKNGRFVFVDGKIHQAVTGMAQTWFVEALISSKKCRAPMLK